MDSDWQLWAIFLYTRPLVHSLYKLPYSFTSKFLQQQNSCKWQPLCKTSDNVISRVRMNGLLSSHIDRQKDGRKTSYRRNGAESPTETGCNVIFTLCSVTGEEKHCVVFFGIRFIASLSSESCEIWKDRCWKAREKEGWGKGKEPGSQAEGSKQFFSAKNDGGSR